MNTLMHFHVCLLGELFSTIAARIGDGPGVDLPDVSLDVSRCTQLDAAHGTDGLLHPLLRVLVLHVLVEGSLVLRLVLALITKELSVTVMSYHVRVEVRSSHGNVIALLTFESYIQVDLVLVDFELRLYFCAELTLRTVIPHIIVNSILVTPQLGSAGAGELAL